MRRESASVYLHFRGADPEEALREILGINRGVMENGGREVEVELTGSELKTVVEALDYLAMAMEAAEFPCSYVDELAERLQEMVNELEG